MTIFSCLGARILRWQGGESEIADDERSANSVFSVLVIRVEGTWEGKSDGIVIGWRMNNGRCRGEGVELWQLKMGAYRPLRLQIFRRCWRSNGI